jgi:hypothetical protein
MNRLAAALLIALSTAVAAPVSAQEDAAPPKAVGVDDKAIMTSQGFLTAHPDLGNRLQGLDSLEDKNYKRALDDFRRAARYGDKPSQGVIAEMYWNGQGVEVDRATAYAWMDLAAERAYPVLLAKREQFWAQLTPEERERAVPIGQALYDEYGDDVAKARLEKVLIRERRRMTGSRVGFVGALEIRIPTPGGMRSVDGSQYYHEKFWNPALYWRWQDYDWKKPGKGSVDVGEVMTDVNEPAADAAAEEGGDPR